MKRVPLNISILMGMMILYALSTLVSTAVMSVGFGVLVLAFLFTPRFTDRMKEIWQTPLTKQYFLITSTLIGVLLFSTVVALLRDPPLYDHALDVNFFQECKKLVYLFTPLMVFSVFNHSPPKAPWNVLRLYWYFLGFLVVIGVIQFFTGWPRAQGLPYGNFAAVLFMGLSLSVSSVLSLALFPVFSYWLSSVKISNKATSSDRFFSPALAGAISLGLCVVVFLTFSRMSWITLPIGVLVLLLASLGRRFFYTAMIVIALVLGGTFFSSQSFRARVMSKGGYVDRIELWKGHLQLFTDHPVLGVGFRQNSKLAETVVRETHKKNNQPVPPEFFGSHAHNNMIEVLAGAGSFGFLAFLMWNLWVIQMLWRGCKSSIHGWWFLGGLIGFLVFHLNGLTQVNFWDSKVLHTLMFFLGVSIYLSIQGNAHARKRI